MRFQTACRSAILVLALAVPALAGSDGQKCTYSTQECLDMMASKMKAGGFVGLELDMDAKTGATVVQSVFPGTPAEAAGLEKGDILYKLNGVVINEKNEDQLVKARGEWKPGQQVTYIIQRNGVERTINLTLASMPADIMAQAVGKHMMQHASTEQLTKK